MCQVPVKEGPAFLTCLSAPRCSSCSILLGFEASTAVAPSSSCSPQAGSSLGPRVRRWSPSITGWLFLPPWDSACHHPSEGPAHTFSSSVTPQVTPHHSAVFSLFRVHIKSRNHLRLLVYSLLCQKECSFQGDNSFLVVPPKLDKEQVPNKYF